MDAKRQPRPWFDPAVLQRLERAADADLVRRLIVKFLESASARLDQARAAAAKEDWDELARVFHSLISSSGNLGGFEMMERCREGHRRIDEGDGPASLEALRAVEAAFARLTPALQDRLEQG